MFREHVNEPVLKGKMVIGQPLRYRLAKALLSGHRVLRWIGGGSSKGTFRVLLFHDIPREQMRAFERLLEYVLSMHGIITPDEAEAILAGQDRVTPNGRVPCLLTFDDGFESHANLAKVILDRYGVKAIFFVCPGLMDLPQERQREAIAKHIFDGVLKTTDLPNEMALMSWSELKDLVTSGHTIGSHTANHRRLWKISEDELRREIIESVDLLTSRLGASIKWFAFPFGNIQSIDRVALKTISHRFKFCCSGIRGMNSAKTHPLSLLREQIDLASPFRYQKLVLEGSWDLYYLWRARRLRSLVYEMGR